MDQNDAEAGRYGLIDWDDRDTRLLVPLPGRPWGYVRHDNRDTLITIAALGASYQKPIHADLYAELRNTYLSRKRELEQAGKKNEEPKPRQYRLANFARKYRCSDQTVRNALADLEKAGLIEITREIPWQLSPIDGNFYAWKHDEGGSNWAERAADAYIRDVQATVPESFREAQDDVSAGLALVAEAASSGTASEEDTARAAAMLAEVARLLGGGNAPSGGGDEPPGPSDGGGGAPSKRPDTPAIKPDAVTMNEETVGAKPKSHAENDLLPRIPDGEPHLDYEQEQGYATLAAMDTKAGREDQEYQRRSRWAYKLVRDEGYTAKGIELGYRQCIRELKEHGNIGYLKKLWVWLLGQDNHSLPGYAINKQRRATKQGSRAGEANENISGMMVEHRPDQQDSSFPKEGEPGWAPWMDVFVSPDTRD